MSETGKTHYVHLPQKGGPETRVLDTRDAYASLGSRASMGWPVVHRFLYLEESTISLTCVLDGCGKGRVWAIYWEEWSK